MALERGRLSTVVQVSAGSTVGITTVANNKKIYVKSIVVHDTGLGGTRDTQVYYVENGQSVSVDNRIFHVSASNKETILIEPSYPIILTQTGDSIHVGSATTTNILILGDKEV